MNTDSFTDFMKTDDVSKDIAENIETRFDSSIIISIDYCLKDKTKK